MDVNKTPEAIRSHGMLTDAAQSFDLLAMHGYVPTQKAAFDSVMNRDQSYIKRQRPKKLDLDLTLL